MANFVDKYLFDHKVPLCALPSDSSSSICESSCCTKL